ncbi:HAMP domain-containing sensor histidine kinase [Ktedonosporobacter rubrisoli]|nr:sensor histidine kinase [Ktedonosporobacter rubrisoli]
MFRFYARESEPVMLKPFSPRPSRSSKRPFFPFPGFASLQMRLGCAYMWTNMLLVVVFLVLVVVVNWLAFWLPHHSPAGQILWWASIFLPGAALLLGVALPIFALIGGLFGLWTSRKLVLRLRQLAHATRIIANGDYYTLRVPVQRKDEVGVLEEQFNRMAQQLAESQQREQELLAQNVRWEERARLARELHDAISQNLFSLRLLAEGMQTSQLEPAVFKEKLALVGRTAETITREMRVLLLELRPVQLEDLGLKEALEELAVMYHARLDLAIVTDIAELALPDQMEHALFRIAQEAISNAVRHAQASWISLKLAARQEQVMLCVEDNGKGFKPLMQESYYGLGLQSMQERVRELKGTLQIQSMPMQGTSISVYLSYKGKNE